MERSLRQVKGSLLVAIPRPLAKKYGLRAGSKVEFEDENAAILLRRSKPPGRAVTLGYEGRKFREFLLLLRRSGVQQVIDVRERPWSRKPGFSGERLMESLADGGLDYVQVRELGSPFSTRKRYRENNNIEEFHEKYGAYLAKRAYLLTILKALLSYNQSAIICFERDWRLCHRGVLCHVLEREGYKFTHL
jgi:uncharacterized protein (DUF488 family)